jgi:glycosyltransferase involved in cell wall biosynthesis
MVVAICTYNNARIFDLTMSTLEKQQVDPSLDWSVLVVDNNSTDETSAVVQQYIQRGHIPGLRVTGEVRQGLCFARQCAVRETSSELIAFLDDDCLLSPNWVEKAAAFCMDHPMAGAVGGRVRLLWEVPPDDILQKQEGCFAKQDFGDLPCQMPSQGWTYLVGAGLVLRRTALLASGWLDRMTLTGRRGKVLSAGDDSELVLRIRNAGYELWYNPAMKLKHYIPKRRASLAYLCRLHRGFGQTDPFLILLAVNQEPTITRCLSALASSLKEFIGLLLTITIQNILMRQEIVPERRIFFYRSLGRLEGAIRLLWKTIN